MKKLFTLTFIVISLISVQAANYFVNPAATASGTGDSWATAYKTIDEAESAANNTTGVDNIFIKGGVTITSAIGWALK